MRKPLANISMLRINEHLVDDETTISDHIVNYYSNLFKSDVSGGLDLSLGKKVVPALVTTFENLGLVAVPTCVEIKSVVFSIDPSSAPGPDGFAGAFYCEFWDIVQADICTVVQLFFTSSQITPGWNTSLMVLILKVNEAISVYQYHPIALSNFCYKIIAKILADRLLLVVGLIISSQ